MANGPTGPTTQFAAVPIRKRVTSLTSRKQILAFGRQELSGVPEAKDYSNEVVLNVSIQRIESFGFRLKEMHGNDLVWEGNHDLMAIIAPVKIKKEGVQPPDKES
jgi:hypothetical protein